MDTTPAEPTLVQQSRLVDALQATLPGSVRHETHLSWVLVTSTRAYKLKKAVAPGFVDYRTRAARQHFCEEEVRLNRRLAPDLYLGVLPITGTVDAPRLGGDGEPIDHVVHMRAFAQDGLWDRLAADRRLTPTQIDALAALVHRFHDGAAVAPPGSRFGTPAQVRAPVLDTLAVLGDELTSDADRARWVAIAEWERGEFDRIARRLEARRRDGRVRECHGDLHLRNIAQIDGRTVAFDGIEFNDDFRWIDVAAEIAFVVMDLHAHGLPALAYRFLDAWLQRGGDFDALAVLDYHVVARALVRAKVAILRLAQTSKGVANVGNDASRLELQRDLALALATTRPRPRALVITHGLSGSGKSTLAQSLLEATGAVRVRADVERKRLAGLSSAPSRSTSPIGGGLYDATSTDATYGRLCAIAAQVLDTGRAVVLDAAFLQRAQRDRARQVAVAAGVPFTILDVTADAAVLRERVARRRAEGRDVSDADLAVLALQQRTAEPLTADECAHAFPVETSMDGAGSSHVTDWTALQRGWMLARMD